MSPPDKGPHYSLITQTLPDWLRTTSWTRAQALASAQLAIEHWHPSATPELKRANAQAWSTQNTVDQQLQALQDLYAFAEPLLAKALNTRHGLNDSVKDTYLFLHTESGTLLKGSTSRTVSLLDAALQNFASRERFTASSSYITRPDQRGHFTIKPLKQRMSIEQFVALCRELDLGKQYQAHLQPPLLQPALQASVIASQKAALDAAAHVALAQKAITAASFHVLQRLIMGERGVMQCYRLQIMDSLLTGILLVAADLDSASRVVPVIAYIPDDPQCPVKEYPSTLAFKQDLSARLREPAYRTFFSRFVDQSQRRLFSSRLDQPAHYAAQHIGGDLWTTRYQQALNKILNDARDLAVSTADADSRARWAWWDNASGLLSEIFNAALLVITPFVPLLGEVMLGYTAYQLLDEVVEGVVDLAEGQALEAAGHLVGVVSDVVQLGAFGIAGALIPSVFVNQLKAVEVNGKTRLWNPDLKPYAQKNLVLPAESTPDSRGLHTHQGRTLLPWKGEHYALEPIADNGLYRILHPERRDAYSPTLQHNDTAAAWDEPRLLHALAPDLDASQRRQALTSSGVSIDVVRGAYSLRKAIAPLLADSLKRAALDQQARRLPEQIRAGIAADETTYWSPHLARELPGWPSAKAIEVYENPQLEGPCVRFGEADADLVLRISRQDLNAGLLPERLVDFLDTDERHAMLGAVPENRAAQIDALREQLAAHLAGQQGAVFDYLYRNSEEVTRAHDRLVREALPELPKSLVDDVLSHARRDERQVMDAEQRLPLRLRNLARERLLQARGSHAYEGFYQKGPLSADSERMLLNTLKLHSDAFGDLHLQIRQHSPEGSLRYSAGPQQASRRRVLVRNDAGRYEVYDGDQQPLHAASDLYEALLHCLSARQRTALGFAPGDGAALKTWLMATLQPSEVRRTVLAEPPLRADVAPDALVLTQKPMHRVPQWSSEYLPPTLEDRVKSLYPFAPQPDIEAYLSGLESPAQRLVFEAREQEKHALQEDLSNWVNRTFEPATAQTTQRRLDLAQALIRSWEHNLNPGEEGIGLSLEGVTLGGQLSDLPRLRASFAHVQHLDLIDAGLLDADTGFIANFPQLVYLSLRSNGLTRLPQAVVELPYLTQLRLDNNPIQWNAASLEQLAGMGQLRQLSLAQNRALTQAPDITGMPHLRALSLRGTGVSEWPIGLFDPPRPANFALDLQNTAISDVPQFLPWQPEAEQVARARIDRNQLSREGEQRLVSYRLAHGLDPYRTYPPKGDITFWLQDESTRHKPWLREMWNNVEREHGSQGFFEVIKSLEQPEAFEHEQDERLYRAHRRELTNKVWRLLIGAEEDQALRTQLFAMASHPINCADAGAHVFNAMGIELELFAARGLLRGEYLHIRLAELAKGKARLDLVNQVAQADIRQRVTPVAQGGQGLRFSTEMVDSLPGTVDEVEVYLAYQSGLKGRLDLPWVSEHMTYRATAEVDDARLDNAYATVQALEAGEGLVDKMLEQPFWDEHLRSTYADQFRASIEHAEALTDRLDDLLFAQKQWASATPEQRTPLEPQLLSLADALHVPHSEVLTGREMSSQTYERLLAAGFTDAQPSEQTLARRLTHEVLQPSEI
ncbi:MULTISPECIES: NEL-type E3 ubiquitin ligase domain-containing protein [Pseudomonas]|uniref:NEL-type E3 ubiquitin ligase domain-containing protein n=1 Tax=Pseudomonas TaxID=286 RepID=UPI001C656C10|nr:MULTISPECIES: NEL-type E3 ubiquitin ligase domain-containing protein [unclassified Pseudomonas]MBW8125841.1 hypothetical protein [Pseudomonas sp. LAP_36]MBW8136544.1 hypothetical protein [Pseudomonas sp. PAMC 26818]